MAVRIIYNLDGACFYDSVTETVFGVLMSDNEEAESFQEWVGTDLRKLTHQEFVDKVTKFRDERAMEIK